jgi:hypothetical protein
MKFYPKPRIVMIRGEWYCFFRGGYGKGPTPAAAHDALRLR